MNNYSENGLANVASFTGAWIETQDFIKASILLVSHPLRVRGLKQDVDPFVVSQIAVASFTDATRSFFRAFKSSSFQST